MFWLTTMKIRPYPHLNTFASQNKRTHFFEPVLQTVRTVILKRLRYFYLRNRYLQRFFTKKVRKQLKCDKGDKFIFYFCYFIVVMAKVCPFYINLLLFYCKNNKN